MTSCNYKHTVSELIELLTIFQIKEIKLKKQSTKHKKMINSLSNQLSREYKKKGKNLNSNLIAQINFIAISNLEIWNLKDKMLNDKKNYSDLLFRAMELNCIRNIISNSINKKYKYNDQTKDKITFFVKKKKSSFVKMEKFYSKLS